MNNLELENVSLREQIAKLTAPRDAAPKSSSDNWCSPSEITIPLEQLYRGPTDVDPCSNPKSIVKARVSYYKHGLVLPWYVEEDPGDQNAYKNPPYSKSAAWFEKAIYEMRIGHVEELVCVVMASTSTAWWEYACTKSKRNPRVAFTKRLAFYDPDAAVAGVKRESCRFEPAMFYYGRRPAAFDREFASIINWSTWGR